MLSAALPVVTFPSFTAKFVHVSFNQYTEIWDATPNLCAVGDTYTQGIDWSSHASFGVVRGRQVRYDQPYWPMSISDDGTCTAYRGRATPDGFIDASSIDWDPQPRFFRGTLGTPRARWRSTSEAPRQHFSMTLTRTGNIETWRPEWRPRGLGTTFIISEQVGCESIRFQRYSIHNVGFDIRLPGDEFHPHCDDSVPLIEIDEKTKKIEDCIIGPAPDQLREIVWVDPRGWMIAVARQGKASGLVWLYPVTK